MTFRTLLIAASMLAAAALDSDGRSRGRHRTGLVDESIVAHGNGHGSKRRRDDACGARRERADSA